MSKEMIKRIHESQKVKSIGIFFDDIIKSNYEKT